jgi:hypothetical protein
LFFSLLACMCGWILSLPLFPSQDGASHKYYAWVVQHVLAGDSWITKTYDIRRPIPPYASQSMILVGLAKKMSLDMADKMFVCLVVLSTALGMRWCCTRLGQAGQWISLFSFPLLLSWSLVKGFMNYSLGVGLMLLIYACWMRAAEGRTYWLPFGILGRGHGIYASPPPC